MSVYDEIQSISNADKTDIILAWYDYLNLKLTEKSICHHFHMMTGHNESIDSIEWYVNQWRYGGDE